MSEKLVLPDVRCECKPPRPAGGGKHCLVCGFQLPKKDSKQMATHRDWIDRMNELSETVAWDDRMMCEMFIMYLDETKRGVAFFDWFKEQVREEAAKQKAAEERRAP